jgi:TetR/AcrR family transcriptional repressor of nem operon
MHMNLDTNQPGQQRITKGQKTKQDILKKANQLFSEKGFDATGIDQIVGELSLSAGVFYNYFNSKLDLLSQVLNFKILRSKESLLALRDKESAADWVQRVLKIYLSVEHKNSIQNSCPMTTLSQELIKLNVHSLTGLAQYTKEFTEILNRRLIMIHPHNFGKANAIMGLCIGAISMARLEADINKSKEILNDALVAALGMIEHRGTHVAKLA